MESFFVLFWSPQKYPSGHNIHFKCIVMTKIVSSSFIANHTNLSISEINALVLASHKTKSICWLLGEPPRVGNPVTIAVKSIPPSYLNKIKSLESSYPYEFSSPLKDILDLKLKLLCLRLKFFYEEDHSDFTFIGLKAYSRSQEEKDFLQRKLTLIDYILKLKDTGEYSLREVYAALIILGLTFYKNETSFYKKIRQYSLEGDYKLFLNKNRFKEKPWKQKHTKLHVSFIGELLGSELDRRQITTELKKFSEDNNINPLSKSTVSRLIRNNKLDVIYAEKRFGTGYVKQEMCSYIEKEKPHYKMQVVEADGSRLQLAYQVQDGSKWSVGYLTLYVIIDVASRKILGYSIDDYENKEMVSLAFFMMLSNYSRLPAHIRIDRSKPHQSNRFKRFLRLANDKGMTFKICYEPKEKGTVENFYRWFPEKICNKYKAYTGLSLVATNWNNKPNPDRVLKLLNSHKNLPTRTELFNAIPQLVNEWNMHNSSENSFPSKIFSELNYKDASFIQENEIAFLTWRIKNKERFSRNTVSFARAGERFSYKCQDYENIIQLHNQPYIMVWLETVPHYIYVYSSEGKFIEKLNRKTVYLDDPINISTEEYSKMIQDKNHNYGLLKHIKNKVKTMSEELEKKNKTMIPYNIATGLNSNKHENYQVESEFVNRHILNRPKDIKEDRGEYTNIKKTVAVKKNNQINFQ